METDIYLLLHQCNIEDLLYDKKDYDLLIFMLRYLYSLILDRR